MPEFRAFDVVECIDDTPTLKQSRTMPRLGEQYRIHSVRRIGDGYSVRLMELTAECYLGGPCNCGNCGWDSTRFRLVDRPAEDKLAVFRNLEELAKTRPRVGPRELID